MFSTGLSMLWESTEPRRALRKRFGFDSFEEAVSWLSKSLAETWAIDVDGCERILISHDNAIAWIRTDRGELIAKWSRARSRFARFAAVAELLQSLHRQGLPVVPPLASVDDGLRKIIDSGSVPLSMTVQPLIVGDLLDTADETAVGRAGACLAELHGALAGNRDERLVEPDLAVDLPRWISEWLKTRGSRIAPAASARLRERVASLDPIDSEPQLIHRDFRSANLITAGSEIVAVLDFDDVLWDHRVSDIANSFVRLGTLFTDWRPTPRSVRETFLAGYESVRPLSRLEHAWLETVALWYGIMAIPAGADPAGWADAL